jgi:hypothetical protein
MKRNEREQLRTAYHEAGHAVMATLCRVPVSLVSILPDLQSGTPEWYSRGRIKALRPCLCDAPKPDGIASNIWNTWVEREVENFVKIGLAGEAAQRQYCPRCVRAVHIGHDRETARGWLLRVREDQVNSRLAELAEQVQVEIDQNWVAVQTLARLLVERGELDRAELEALMDSGVGEEQRKDGAADKTARYRPATELLGRTA